MITVDELIKKLNEIALEEKNTKILFESNRHKFGNAKIVKHKDNIVISLYDKIEK